MKRVVMFTDTHFGVKNNSVTWFRSQEKFIRDELIPYIKKSKPDEVIHLGDVFDYYNLIYRENHNHYFLARRTRKTEIHQEPDEVKRVKGIIWVSIDEAIRLYENMQDELVGKLVKQRELPILKLAKLSLQSKSK